MAWDEFWNCMGPKIGQNADLIVWALNEAADDVKEAVKDGIEDLINWFMSLDPKVLALIALANVYLKDIITALAKKAGQLGLGRLAGAIAKSPYFWAALVGAIIGVGLGVVIDAARNCWSQWDVAAAA